MRWMFVLLATGAFFCPAAQVPAEGNGAVPLRMTSRMEGTGREAEAVLALQNASGKAVAAFAIRLIRRGEDGKPVSIRTHAVATRGIGMSFGRPSFQPGEVWEERVQLGEAAPVEPDVDLVLFEDGTSWGPNKSKQLERFLGMKDGARLEREAVRR